MQVVTRPVLQYEQSILSAFPDMLAGGSMISADELKLFHLYICQSMADPKRIEILYALSEGASNVSALTALLDTPQSTISRHLGHLRQRGLVISERQGKNVVYSVADPRIIQALDLMRNVLQDALKQHSSVYD
jgi:ArsR family transcriptional regulator